MKFMGQQKFPSVYRKDFNSYILLNSTLTPIDISKGLHFVPGVVDKASTHLERIRTEVKRPT